MAEIQITVNGRGYDVACHDGEEERLRGLARDLDRRVVTLAQSVGQVGDTRLLLMTCLLIADELAEAKAETQRAKAAEAPARRALEERLVATLDRLTQRIESIAAELEAA